MTYSDEKRACILFLLLASITQIAGQVSNPMNIPVRLQWVNAFGYCGEMSVQMAALNYGNYLSQGALRLAGGGGYSADGQLLVSVNLETVLGKMRLTYERWDQTAVAKSLAQSKKSQYTAFMTWMKAQLLIPRPVIIGEYVSDAYNDPDYDHIIPVVGVTNLPNIADNSITFYNLYSTTQHVMKVSTFGTTRAQCTRDLLSGGCAPLGTDYGVAVVGNADANRVCLKVRLDLDRNSEPNYSPVDRNDDDEYRTVAEKPVLMNGRVTVSGLVTGKTYRLMRYNSPAAVPVKGTAADFIRSSYNSYTDFKATGPTYIKNDTFMSNGTIFYRCVLKV